MHHHKRIALTLSIPALFGLASCDGPTTPADHSVVYARLDVGDIRQSIYSDDSSTVLEEVIGTTNRSDGRKVYIVSSTQGTSMPDTFYEFIENGYLVTTLLDSVDTTSDAPISTNPFREQRIAKIDPHDGDTWVHTIGGDSSVTWNVRGGQEFASADTTFTDVFALALRNESRVILTAYYARGIGWVGSIVPGVNGYGLGTCYLNVGGTETGARKPARAALLSHVASKKLPVISAGHTIAGGIDEVGRTSVRRFR